MTKFTSFATPLQSRFQKTLSSFSWAKFSQDCRGNIAIIGALSILPVTMSLGAAVDYSRIVHTRSVLASALDAAVIATAKDLSNGSITELQVGQRLTDFFEVNVFSSGLKGITANIDSYKADPANGSLTASVSVALPMQFMALAGISNMKVATEAEAVYSDKNIELSMMLDVTGSMGHSGKLNALKVAAKDAIDILIADNAINKAKVKIGLVPYSYSVNAGDYAKLATHHASYKCVTERGGTKAFTDDSYNSWPVGADPRAVLPKLCPAKTVRPLTNDKTKLKNDINGLSAGGYTAGHLGVAWSYYMLSPKWGQLWPASAAKSYADKKTVKIALLMTDGEFNTFYDGTTGTAWGPNAAPSSNVAMKLCKDMKMKGITVYSVAFQAPASAKATLQNCATPNSGNNTYYYAASNASQLKVAFQQIAINIQNLRLSR